MASAASTLHFSLSLTTPKPLSAKLFHFSSLSLKPLSAKPLSVTSHRPRFLLRHVTEFDQALTDSPSAEEVDEVSFSDELKLFVGNLPFSVDSASLAGVFEQAGNVEMVEVIYDKQTGRSRGFGFVTMSTVEEVETAVQKFNGYELEGRALRVNAGPPPPKSESPFRAPRVGGGGGGGGSFDNNNKVYVGNLSWGVDDLALRTLFSEQGQVMEARVIYDRDSGRSKGFGFVTYGSADEVNNAIESLDGVDLDGRPIRVSVAESRPPRRQF